MYQPTFERRWLITNAKLPFSTAGAPTQLRQVYLALADGRMMRLRSRWETEDPLATIAVKHGHGVTRTIEEREIDEEAAEALFEVSGLPILEKRRWSGATNLVIDEFLNKEFGSLNIAEIKLQSADETASLPDWLEGIEVTNSLTNEHLFELLCELSQTPAKLESPNLLLDTLPLVVITGGPGSGKSTVIDEIVKRHGDVVHCVREVATVVISHMRVPPPCGDALKTATFQRTIFDVQRRFERVSSDHALLTGKKLVVTDRATMDGACYLPGGVKEFERVCRTDRYAEYARYDKVICLDTPPPEVYAAIVGNNPARSETYARAVELGAAIIRSWEDHLNFTIIPATSTWEEKLELVLAELDPYLSE